MMTKFQSGDIVKWIPGSNRVGIQDKNLPLWRCRVNQAFSDSFTFSVLNSAQYLNTTNLWWGHYSCFELAAKENTDWIDSASSFLESL